MDNILIKDEIKDEVFPDEFEVYDVQMIDDSIKIEVMNEDDDGLELGNQEVRLSPATLTEDIAETTQSEDEKVEVIDINPDVFGAHGEQLIDLTDDTEYDSFTLEVRAEGGISIARCDNECGQSQHIIQTQEEVEITDFTQNIKSPIEKVKDAVNHCHICGSSFTEKELFSRHLLEHERMGKRCTICKKVLQSMYDFKMHIASDHIKTCIKCTICKMVFGIKNFGVHVATAHPDAKKYVCNDCKVTFQLNSFKKHILLHPGPHECPECKNTFVSRSGLSKHLTECSGLIGPHRCKFCKANFPNILALDFHCLGVISGSKRIPFCVGIFCSDCELPKEDLVRPNYYYKLGEDENSEHPQEKTEMRVRVEPSAESLSTDEDTDDQTEIS